MKLYSKIFVVVVIFLADVYAQNSDPTLRRIGFHTGNRVGISFYNDGQVAGFSAGTDIRGEWPLGSGENYIGDCIPLIGVEFMNSRAETLHSVAISRGPRNGQARERHPVNGYFWGWNPKPGYLNPNQQSIAMSHLPESWPISGWKDHSDWVDQNGVTQWNGYFGRGIVNADQESYFVADDQWDDEFNSYFKPNRNDSTRNGMGLEMAVRGFQWSNFLAEDVIFWLYDIKNVSTTTYRKSVFGTVVGTLAGGDGDSQDDLGYFDIDEWITYSWDSDGRGNKGQKVGYVGYAFLESPGNPFDGIDNDDDSPNTNSPKFVNSDFDSVVYIAGNRIVLIDSVTYERTLYTIQGPRDTVYTLGQQYIIVAGVTKFSEGRIDRIVNGVSIPNPSAYDGLDNDLDGLIDENQAIHLETRQRKGLPGLRFKNYRTGAGVNDPLIDEKRDNDAGSLVSSWQRTSEGTVQLVSHWSGDEDADWDPNVDDVGSDGVGPNDDGYLGPDADGTENNGRPDQGEPNFGKTDPDESDQIGLTSFNFFNLNAAPDLSNDELVWSRMTPGRFDIIPPVPQDGDFIYASGYFPLRPSQIERFSVALLFGENYEDILRNKTVVQQIYNAGYKFPQPPRKPKVRLTERDGNVVIYWDGDLTENSKDFITKRKDFQGYKIYRATDAGFQDARTITNALGVFSFDKPIVQFDLKDSIDGFFQPSRELLYQVGGTTFYLGSNTGTVNTFIDSTVVPGVRYYYAVCAYDNGDEKLGIFPAENSKFIFRTSTGEIITDDNTGFITPSRRPIGYVDANSSNVEKLPNFRGTGSAWVEIVDDKAIEDGHTYKIIFEDSALQGYTKNWTLIDVTNSSVTGDDTLITREPIFYGNTPIVHGMRVQMLNHNEIVRDTVRSGYSGITSSPPPAYTLTPFFWTASGPGVAYNGIKTPDDYEIEFSNSIVDTSVADTLFPPTPSNTIPAKPITFRVKNLSTNQYLNVVYFKTGTVGTIHNIYFKEKIDSVVYRTWRVNILYNTANAPIEQNGTLRIATLKPFSRNDGFQFTLRGAKINSDKAKQELDKVKVVPNPYVVTHEGEPRLLSTQTSGRGERNIRFTHVPPGSKISIFTIRGELVKSLRHDDLYSGDVFWNLRTEENLDAAYGVYIFVLEAENIGTKTGRFALIK
ncbi:MAG TPA: hypothetical protein VFF29_07780 [Bacteroidota bacterium]|nr:hypothetical protein [Bacteroidota bacterium]